MGRKEGRGYPPLEWVWVIRFGEGGWWLVAQLARGRVPRSPQMGREESCSSDPARGW